VSFVFLIAALPGVTLGAVGYVALDGVVAVGTLVGGGVIVVVAIMGSQPASAIVRTAPYRYATTGERAGPLNTRDPDAVFTEI
jgi:hypothetical protein